MDVTEYYVYLLTNRYHNVLYTGVTNDILRRIYEHKAKLQKGFTKRFNVDQLVYFEIYAEIDLAMGREKQIKSWARWRKDQLIIHFNPAWKDLFEEIC